MNVLVTGGAGFIGSFITDMAIDKGYKVRILDNLDPQVHPGGKPPQYLSKKAEFIKGDVRNREDIRKAIAGMDIIYHMAASVGVGQSNYEISNFVHANSLGTANLFNEMIGRKIRKVIIPGSNTSYGEGMYHCKACNESFHAELRSYEQLKSKEWEVKCPECSRPADPIPIKEDADLRCNSIYSITKKNQEEIALFLGKIYDIPVTVFRFFNVYGPRQSLNNPYSGVSAIFTGRIKANRPPVIYEDGLQTRDFISVKDIARAALLVAEDSRTDFQCYNVGSANPITLKSLASILAKGLDSDLSPVVSGEFRKGDVRHCFGDISKIKSLGWEPKVKFERGIKETIEWAEQEKVVDKFDQADKELREKGLL